MKNTRNIKIFIVFNDSFSRMLYRQHLVKLGYKDNILIENGADCLKKLDLEPDIVFLDHDMHPMNGLEVLQQIKEQYPEMHVLLISCPNNKKAINDALKFGADGCITKGHNDLEMLRKAVEIIAAKKRGDLQPQLVNV